MTKQEFDAILLLADEEDRKAKTWLAAAKSVSTWRGAVRQRYVQISNEHAARARMLRHAAEEQADSSHENTCWFFLNKDTPPGVTTPVCVCEELRKKRADAARADHAMISEWRARNKGEPV